MSFPPFPFLKVGPNSTTWLVTKEIFPNDVRSSYLEFCACMGKLGALFSAMLLSYASNQMIFILFTIWSLFGLIVAFIWLPCTTCPDLTEYECMNACLLLGKFAEYHGEAINEKHLSLWECSVLGWGENYISCYDSVLNAQQMEGRLREELRMEERQLDEEEGHLDGEAAPLLGNVARAQVRRGCVEWHQWSILYF